jgi:hypothetical protein
MDPKAKGTTVEEQLSVMAAELGCDKEVDWLGCEACDRYDECVAKVRMKPPSSEE